MTKEIPKVTSDRMGLLKGMLQDTRNYLLKEIEGITQDELDFSPDPARIETVGTMLFHIADVENSWIFEHIAGEEIDFEKWKYAFPLRIGIPQRIGKPLEFYLETLKEVRLNVLEFLEQFDETDLDRMFESKMGSTTLEWALFHIHRHEQHHVGQINLLRRLKLLS
ncbi:MAG: DinB family protein [Methanobacteriota archaeon]|nr:MAG: DinB family protein [Euryarchaeota archaeon]